VKFHFYQIVIVGISSIMLFQGIKEFVKREAGQTFVKLMVRLIVWGGMVLVAIYPDFTRLMANIIGIEDNINAIIMTGFLFVFVLIFKLLSAIEKIEQNVSELTRKEAMSELYDKIKSKAEEIGDKE